MAIIITISSSKFALISLSLAMVIGISGCDSHSVNSKPNNSQVNENNVSLTEVSYTEPSATSLIDEHTAQLEPVAVNERDEVISNEVTEEVLDTDIVATAQDDSIDCDTVRMMIEAIGESSRIEDIRYIDSQLPTCLENSDRSTVLSLLKAYDAMYDRFLYNGTDTNPEARRIFGNLLSKLESTGGLSQTELDTLPKRTQYLITLLQSDEGIYSKYLGDGDYIFSQDLVAMTSKFTPYMQTDEVAFVTRMALDNRYVFEIDAGINRTFEQLMNSALFWENYIKQYPNGRFTDDAKILYDSYRSAVFYGAENTPWVDRERRYFFESEDERLMRELANRQESRMARDAQKYLDFLDMPEEERQQRYPVDSISESGYERDDWIIAGLQLEKALPLPPSWEPRNDRQDCLNGIFCSNYEK